MAKTKIRLIKALFLLPLLALLPSTNFNSQASIQPPNHPIPKLLNSQTSFQSGEEITYKIYYHLPPMWLGAGEVTFKVWDEGNQFHYQAIGRTYDSYEWFFKVDDRYDSWVDKNSLLPNYSERSVEEGKYHIFEKIAFNQSAKQATVSRSERRGATETHSNHALRQNVHDVLSTLYFLRNFDFAVQQIGYQLPFAVFMDKEEFPLQMKYLGKDEKKKVHGMGRYRTMKFEPQVIAGNVFNEKSKMTVWVSDDSNRIPILIEAPVSVGKVKVVLKRYAGLKHEFTAKVD